MKIMWYKISIALVFLTFSMGYSKPILAANQIWDEFPLVKDKRNFKVNTGGKSFGPQGRIIPTLQTFYLNEDKIQEYQPEDKNWRYVVAMNCARNGRSVLEILTEVQTKLISENEQDRLAVVLGINERVTVDNPPDYTPTWEEILGTPNILSTFQDIKIPILLVYFQWTSFREVPNNEKLSPGDIRQSISQRLQSLQNERQHAVALKKLQEQDSSHQFPFGKARTFLLQNLETQKFISTLHQSSCSVYVHIQDSDFVSYEEPLIFGNFQRDTPLIPANQNRLFEKFDHVIAYHQKQNGRLPIIVGGAHVYNPEEDLEKYLENSGKEHLNSIEAKCWTRFASEMGNDIKHIIGQQQPYGLYFHEPNSLVLSPASASILINKNDPISWQVIYSNLARGFGFGIDSEMQDFTRSLFDNISDDICRQGMVFSATTVLSTSMKSGTKPFAIDCKGNYNPETRKFKYITQSDLSAIRRMKQEIITPYKWGSNIATSFSAHKSADARTLVCQALRLFDPLDTLDPTNEGSFLKTLVNYNSTIEAQAEDIKKLFYNLRGSYDKLNNGNIIALQIITAGWETGQIMRLMFLNHLEPPAGMIIPPLKANDQQIQLFLSDRFNFKPQAQNPFIVELLNFTSLSKQPLVKVEKNKKTNLTKPKIASVVQYLYDLTKNEAQTARLIGIKDVRRIKGLKEGKCQDRTWQPIAQNLETSEKVRQFFLNKLTAEQSEYILTLLL